MEVQVSIVTLEKELTDARRRLGEMRKFVFGCFYCYIMMRVYIDEFVHLCSGRATILRTRSDFICPLRMPCYDSLESKECLSIESEDQFSYLLVLSFFFFTCCIYNPIFSSFLPSSPLMATPTGYAYTCFFKPS
jgi:hypothetical protein